MVTDPIADLLIRLGNGARRRHDSIHVPASRLKREMLAKYYSEKDTSLLSRMWRRTGILRLKCPSDM